MRFLMLNWRDPVNPLAGGAERVSIAYMRALRDRGHDVSWFANDFPGAKPEETIDGIHFVRGGGKGTSILRARAWYRTQPKFDLIIDQHHGLPWFAPWWSGTRCVAYIHEVLGPIWNSFYPWPVSTIGRAQERFTHWLYRKTPFWTVSESTRQQLLAHGVKDVTVVPNSTDVSAVLTLEAKPLSQPVRLAVVSRLAPNKRIDHAIQSVNCLQSRGVQATMSIIGTGEVEPALRRQVEELGLGKVVTFAGHLRETEKNELLRNVHFLIHTSIREGWGLNVIEANAMGSPAVVYPVGGLVDSTVHGVTGIVTDTETPDAIAQAIAGVLQQPAAYDSYRRAAWERSKAFHWNQVLKIGCDFLEGLACGERQSKAT